MLIKVFMIVGVWCQIFQYYVILFQYFLVQFFQMVVVYKVLQIVLLVLNVVDVLEEDVIVIVIFWNYYVDDLEVVVWFEMFFVWNRQMYLVGVVVVQFNLVKVNVVLFFFFEDKVGFCWLQDYIGFVIVFCY